MTDNQSLPKNEQVPNQEPPPQYMATMQVPNQVASPQYMMTATRVISVPSNAPIFRTPQDEEYISSIRNKAIASLVLSTVASLCLWPLFCTIPAIILAILALVEKTNLGTANSYAKAAVALTAVSTLFGTLLLVLSIIYWSNYDNYETRTYYEK